MNPSQEVTSATPPARLQPPGIWLAALLFIVTAALFYRATSADFLVYDDTTFVIRNAHVATGINAENIRHAFIGLDEVNWDPLSTLSHALDCQIFGSKQAWGHHLVNVLIHALNAALLFLLLRKLTNATWRSLVVALLFALHPLRVESVAWVAERKDVLCVTFWLLATWAYVRYTESNRKRTFYWLTLLLFAFGLMAKPMMVTFPFFLLLLDYWPLKRFSNGAGEATRPTLLILEKIPLILFSAADCFVTYVLQQQYGAGAATAPGPRIANALVSYARYLGKFLWPTNLAVLYPWKDDWSVFALVISGVTVVGITVAAFMLRKRAPWMLMGWLWYLGTLVPVIGLVAVGEQSIADRYTYFPMIGIALIVVWAAHELLPNWRKQWIVPVGALCCCYAVLTWRQIGYWQDSHALFERTARVTEGNYVANTILADVYHAHGDGEKALDLLSEALRINPTFVPAAELRKTWQCEEAVAMGKNLMRQRRWDQALFNFETAKQLRPFNAEARYSLGVIYVREKELPQAVKEFKVAFALQPGSPQIRSLLAFTLLDTGRKEQALKLLDAAVKEHPESFDAHSELALALSKSGHRKECIEQLKAALVLRPDDRATAAHIAEMEAAEKR